MHIHFATRPDVHRHPGGDTLHLEQVMRSLEQRGHRVSLHDKAAWRQADVHHFFNLGRPEHLLRWLPPRHRPLVIHSLLVQYRSTDAETSLFRRATLKLLGAHGMAYFKVGARVFRGQHRLPPLRYILLGQHRSERLLTRRAGRLITASSHEAQQVQKRYGFGLRPNVIPPGLEHFPAVPPPSHQEAAVLCVARIEPLKNQLRLIEACKKLKVPLHLVGEASPNHQAYFKRCQAAASAQVTFHGTLPREEVARLMQRFRVHALPSLFETTGLSTLEALGSHCLVVVSAQPIQRELWGQRAFYCEPRRVSSIIGAIRRALSAPPLSHASYVRRRFSWAQGAEKIDDLYRALL